MADNQSLVPAEAINQLVNAVSNGQVAPIDAERLMNSIARATVGVPTGVSPANGNRQRDVRQ